MWSVQIKTKEEKEKSTKRNAVVQSPETGWDWRSISVNKRAMVASQEGKHITIYEHHDTKRKNLSLLPSCTGFLFVCFLLMHSPRLIFLHIADLLALGNWIWVQKRDNEGEEPPEKNSLGGCLSQVRTILNLWKAPGYTLEFTIATPLWFFPGKFSLA